MRLFNYTRQRPYWESTRTRNLRFRKPALCPVELQGSAIFPTILSFYGGVNRYCAQKWGMLEIISQKLGMRQKRDADLIDMKKTLEEDFPGQGSMEVGIPSPFPVNQDASATMTITPGSDQKLSIEDLQQQVSQLDATLTIIKQQLRQLM